MDDPSGVPLGGIQVKIAPWTSLATPLPAPQTTTAPDGTFALSSLPNGHYLLIIGSDSPADTSRPTVHDNVTLTGGTQALRAPVLPAIPLVTPPPAETGGSYRLMSLDATAEVPCFTAFNAQRTARSLPLVVEDEWLSENTREWVQARQSTSFVPGMQNPSAPLGGYLATGNVANGGGTTCAASNIAIAFSSSAQIYAANAATTWFGGLYQSAGAASAAGFSEFPIDPRTQPDPNISVWP